MTAAQLVRLLRPHQYAKNLLVFAAPGAAGRLDEGSVLAQTLAAFALFCLVSSAGYVANDLADAEADRRHPTKQHRPIASGAVSPLQARIMLAVLVAVAVAGAPWLGGPFSGVLAGYGALSALYSALLKRVPGVELISVSTGFVLRAVAGGAATDTAISGWFLVVVSAGSLLLITGKRLGELVSLGRTSVTRPVLTHYSATGLRLGSTVAAAVAIGGYSTWAAAEAADRAPGSSALLQLTAIPFVVAIIRYLALSWRGKGEAPERVVLSDPVIVAAGLVWATSYTIGLYT